MVRGRQEDGLLEERLPRQWYGEGNAMRNVTLNRMLTCMHSQMRIRALADNDIVGGANDDHAHKPHNANTVNHYETSSAIGEEHGGMHRVAFMHASAPSSEKD